MKKDRFDVVKWTNESAQLMSVLQGIAHKLYRANMIDHTQFYAITNGTRNITAVLIELNAKTLANRVLARTVDNVL